MLDLDHYQFHSQLLLRTPTRPFLTTSITPAKIEQIIADEHFMESLHLASPVLVQECRKWQLGELSDVRKVEKLRRSLTRYYVRATSRCTPFGLFAGCGLVRWGTTTRITLHPDQVSRHTRLDMHYLCTLAQGLADHPAIRPHLRYRPNSSLYETGEEIRLIDYHYAHGERVHELSAVAATPHLQQVLAAALGGQSYAALVANLVDRGVTASNATAFLDELITSQLLVHELEPTVTGPEFLHQIQAVLTRLVITSPADPFVSALAARLEAVRQQLLSLDKSLVNDPARYEQLAALLVPLGVPPEAGKLLQTDTLLGLAPMPTLDITLQAELRTALQALAYLSAPPTHTRLANFCRRFQTRYEDQEVPLLEALDNESGLSYTDYGQSSYAPLVQDLLATRPVPPPASPAPTVAQQFLTQQLWAATRSGQFSLALTDDDLSRLALPLQPLPPSLAVVFRLLDEGQLVVESAGGASAINLLGRFAHADPAIAELVREVAATEQQYNPGVAFAEISHLPASRLGNVLLRPNFRAFEIPYLAQSVLPVTGQVPVQDLLVAVRSGQVVLRSRSTGQRIVPRLGTAHNFAGEHLPVYQFLCDLQTQGLQPRLAVDWPEMAASAKFRPRLTYRRVVLSPATWRLDAADWQHLLVASPVEFAVDWQTFCCQWQLPRWFTLTEGDNELLIDAADDWLVRLWLDTVRSRPSCQLKEFLLDPAASPIRDARGQPYAQQFVGLLVRQSPCYPATIPPPPAVPAEVPREFTLGSEWLYYKLYCGQQVADHVLVAVLHPLTEELRAQGLLDNWFFIRYADPDNHLRVRLHLTAPQHLGRVITLMQESLASFRDAGTVWKVQTDTYRRELERYGPRTIGLCEELFGYQSAAVLQRLVQVALLAETEIADPDPWLWGLGAIEELLNACAYPLARKITLLQGLRESFAREFAIDKTFRLKLDAKYREARPAITQQLAQAASTVLPAPLAVTGQYLTQLEAQGQLEVPLDQLLASLLHMLLNRLLPAEARLHELVLYDFLCRHYQARQAQTSAIVATSTIKDRLPTPPL